MHASCGYVSLGGRHQGNTVWASPSVVMMCVRVQGRQPVIGGIETNRGDLHRGLQSHRGLRRGLRRGHRRLRRALRVHLCPFARRDPARDPARHLGATSTLARAS